MPGAQSTQIFTESDIKAPMQLVLNPPVFAHGLGKLLSLGREAAQVEPLLDGGLPAQGTRGFHHPNALEPGPRYGAQFGLQVSTDPRAARLHPPMPLLGLFVIVTLRAVCLCFWVRHKEALHRLL